MISARNVWKLFGDDPEGCLATMPEGHGHDDIRADGYIAGVKDVSLDVGRAALEERKAHPHRELVGFQVEGGTVPSPGDCIRLGRA